MRMCDLIASKAPAPSRRPHFPLGGFGRFQYLVCAPPAAYGAVGEVQRYTARVK
jgi:hypothetical protein